MRQSVYLAAAALLTATAECGTSTAFAAGRRALSSTSHPWDYVAASSGDASKDTAARASTDVEKDTKSKWCFDCGWLGKGRSPRTAVFTARPAGVEAAASAPAVAPVIVAAPAGAPAPGLPRR